jgi:hypothetical protein
VAAFLTTIIGIAVLATALELKAESDTAMDLVSDFKFLEKGSAITGSLVEERDTKVSYRGTAQSKARRARYARVVMERLLNVQTRTKFSSMIELRCPLFTPPSLGTRDAAMLKKT